MGLELYGLVEDVHHEHSRLGEALWIGAGGGRDRGGGACACT